MKMLASVTPQRVGVEPLKERGGERRRAGAEGSEPLPHALRLPPPGARLLVRILCASVSTSRGKTASGTRVLMSAISVLSFFRISRALD